LTGAANGEAEDQQCSTNLLVEPFPQQASAVEA
jgi:hypothetical protein